MIDRTILMQDYFSDIVKSDESLKGDQKRLKNELGLYLVLQFPSSEKNEMNFYK